MVSRAIRVPMYSTIDEQKRNFGLNNTEKR